jgi:hypothetical protein
MIRNIEATLLLFSAGSLEVDQLKAQHVRSLQRRYFRGPMSVEEVIDLCKKRLEEEQTETQVDFPGDNSNVSEDLIEGFKLSPLSDNRHNFRLLHLHPGDKEDPIRCTVVEERLEEALSYEVSALAK